MGPWEAHIHPINYLTRGHGRALPVLWPTAFQLQASKALYALYTTTEDAGCVPGLVFAFITQAFNRITKTHTKTFTGTFDIQRHGYHRQL